MNPFDQAVEFVLKHEGDYVNDPHDSGGETKFGISRRVYPDLDIKELTRQQAIEIYRKDYWNACKCNELPGGLALIVFDAAVNQGAPTAVRLLQKALSVRVDGVMGPETIAAAHRASPSLAVAELVSHRAYQYGLHPGVARFGLGWFRRLTACHQIALSL